MCETRGQQHSMAALHSCTHPIASLHGCFRPATMAPLDLQACRLAPIVYAAHRCLCVSGRGLVDERLPMRQVANRVLMDDHPSNVGKPSRGGPVVCLGQRWDCGGGTLTRETLMLPCICEASTKSVTILCYGSVRIQRGTERH